MHLTSMLIDISANINGALYLSGRAAIIFVEIIIEDASKVRSTVTLNRIDLNDLCLKTIPPFLNNLNHNS